MAIRCDCGTWNVFQPSAHDCQLRNVSVQMCSPSLASVSQGQCAHQSAPIGLHSVSHGVPVGICVSPSETSSHCDVVHGAPGSLRRRSLYSANTSPILWTQDDHTFLDVPFAGPHWACFRGTPDVMHQIRPMACTGPTRLRLNQPL